MRTPGEIVGGKYQLVQEIGAGGFGSVWRATGADGASVAVKFLKPGLDGDIGRRFDREAAILADLRHPNIVEFFHFEGGGQPWLATQFVEGEDLSDWIGPQRSVDECIDVCAQIATALEAAHRQGIIHRDLKPANIMVSRRSYGWHVTVLDFGLGKLFDGRQGDITATGEVLGTPGFMSPEQLRGETGLGPATDLYCLGAVMFAVFECAPVFAGESALETAMKHLTDHPPPMRSAAPHAVKDLVQRLLAKRPSDRPASAAAVLRVLRPRDATDAPSPGRQGARTVAAIAVVLALAVVVAMWGSDPTQTPTRRVAQRMPANLLRQPEPVGPDADEQVEPAPALQVSRSVGCSLQIDVPDPKGLVRPPPDHRRDEPLPLLVLLHDRGQTPAGLIKETGLLPIAVRERFIVAAPQVEVGDEVEIAGFVDDVTAAHCVDTDRVYALGHGSGSEVVERLRSLPIFAAVAVTAHRLERREIKRPGAVNPLLVPYLLLTAEHDSEEPIEGRGAAVPLARHEEYLRREHGCAGAAKSTEVDGGVCRSWSCGVDLRSCVIEGNRPWPPKSEQRQARVWDFLSQHRRSDRQKPAGCEHSPTAGFVHLGDDVAFVPENVEPGQRLPLVIALHEKRQRPQQLLDELDLYDLAARDGFVLYAPRGPMTLDGGLGEDEISMWKPSSVYSNDIARTRAVFQRALERATATFCIDPEAVYVVGHVGGGYITESLRSHDAIAAVSSFSYRRDRRRPPSNVRPTRPYLFIAPLDSEEDPAEGGRCDNRSKNTSVSSPANMAAAKDACPSSKADPPAGPGRTAARLW